jgi:hypothetical protein
MTREAPVLQIQAKNSPTWKVPLDILQIRRWAKNLIAYAPLLLSGKLHDVHPLLLATLCVAALCLASAANYILKDVCVPGPTTRAKRTGSSSRPNPIRQLPPISLTLDSLQVVPVPGLQVRSWRRSSIDEVSQASYTRRATTGDARVPRNPE